MPLWQSRGEQEVTGSVMVGSETTDQRTKGGCDSRDSRDRVPQFHGQISDFR